MNPNTTLNFPDDFSMVTRIDDLDGESPRQRHQRYTQLVCVVVLVVSIFALGLSVFFSLAVSWSLWSGSAVAACAWAFPSALSWRLAQAGKSTVAAHITIISVSGVIAVTYWMAPYFALYLIFLFILTVVHILLGPRLTVAVGAFLFANTFLYALVHQNHMFAPDGQQVTVDYGTFALWWVFIGGTGWLVSFLYHSMQRDNYRLHRQTIALQKAQQRLGESEARYRALSQASFEGIILHEHDTILETNQTLADMFGYQPGELVGRSLQEILHGMPPSVLTRADTPRPGESLAVKRDGSTFPIERQSRDFVYRGHPVEVSAIRDITARKKTEAALTQSQHQLVQAQKVESLGRLAGGIAHDFNNLLTVILSYSDLLEDATETPLVPKLYIAQIREAGQRAAGLTRQLLAFSRQQILQPQVLNVNARVLAMETLLHRLIGEDIVLQTVLAPEVAPVVIDPGQFEQIVMNLALNARDAMPDGGTLTFETAHVSLQENAIWDQPSFAVKTGEYVMLAVSDTGIGMDAETQARIFEPFFTTKEPGRGTGLGLATIYGIVHQSGGYIWVYSTPQVGTTIKVYLPRNGAGGDHPTPVEEDAPSMSAYTGGETILVVEDDTAVRRVIGQILERFGYQVYSAGDGREALALLAASPFCPDVILTDVIMPHMGGVELLTKLQTLPRRAKRIAMSGYTDRVAGQQGILSLCDHYVQKPFTPNDLTRAIRAVLEPRTSG